MPGPGEVLVRVVASTVQMEDALLRRGLLDAGSRARSLDTTGFALAGVVIGVGRGVTRWNAGDRVADWCVTGGNARFAICEARDLVKVPERLSADRAAVVVGSHLVAYQSLFRFAHARRGDTVLVLGGHTAIGLAGIELARRVGATVFATVPIQHSQLVWDAGATPAFGVEALGISGGADVVLDTLGARSLTALTGLICDGGHAVVASVGSARGVEDLRRLSEMVVDELRGMFTKPSRRVSTYGIGRMRAARRTWIRQDMETLMALAAGGQLRPRVGEELAIHQVPRAHERLEESELAGSAVVYPWAA